MKHIDSTPRQSRSLKRIAAVALMSTLGIGATGALASLSFTGDSSPSLTQTIDTPGSPQDNVNVDVGAAVVTNDAGNTVVRYSPEAEQVPEALAQVDIIGAATAEQSSPETTTMLPQ